MLLNRAMSIWAWLENVLGKLGPVASLAARLWIALVFFRAGLSKIQDWETTLWLFTDEYKVPLLPPAVAAVLGTAVELVFPVLLALGLGGRTSVGVLFLFNIIAVVSYYGALGAVGLKDHYHWGLILLLLLAYGPGSWSLDRLLCRLWRKA